MPLDKSKSYAQVMGSTDGSRFEQNGVLFDHEGSELNAAKPEIIEEPIAENAIIETPKKRGRPAKVNQ